MRRINTYHKDLTISEKRLTRKFQWFLTKEINFDTAYKNQARRVVPPHESLTQWTEGIRYKSVRSIA